MSQAYIPPALRNRPAQQATDLGQSTRSSRNNFSHYSKRFDDKPRTTQSTQSAVTETTEDNQLTYQVYDFYSYNMTNERFLELKKYNKQIKDLYEFYTLFEKEINNLVELYKKIGTSMIKLEKEIGKINTNSIVKELMKNVIKKNVTKDILDISSELNEFEQKLTHAQKSCHQYQEIIKDLWAPSFIMNINLERGLSKCIMEWYQKYDSQDKEKKWVRVNWANQFKHIDLPCTSEYDNLMTKFIVLVKKVESSTINHNHTVILQIACIIMESNNQTASKSKIIEMHNNNESDNDSVDDNDDDNDDYNDYDD